MIAFWIRFVPFKKVWTWIFPVFLFSLLWKLHREFLSTRNVWKYYIILIKNMKSSVLMKKMFFSVVKIFAGFSSRTCHILQVYVFKQHRRSSVHKHTKIKIIDIRKRGWMETQPKGKYKPFALAKKTNKRWMQIQQRNIRIEKKKKKTCAEPQSRKQLTEKHKTANMESILRINGIYVFCLRFSRVCLMDILLSTEIITLFRIYFTSSSKRIKTKPSIFEYRFEYITVVCVCVNRDCFFAEFVFLLFICKNFLQFFFVSSSFVCMCANRNHLCIP